MRASGILLPVFSLPGEYGIGCFSKEAYNFIDKLNAAGQRYWQILPLGHAGGCYSPYQPLSCFAMDPAFMDPDPLIDEGLIEPEDSYPLKTLAATHPKDKIDYDALLPVRMELLRKAYGNYCINHQNNDGFKAFCNENAFWLDDYALFISITKEYQDPDWSKWDRRLKMRDPAALEDFAKSHEDDIGLYKWLQMKLHEQWQAIVQYAHKKGIEIIGDIPIYSAYESADCWAHPELFKLTKSLRPEAVAGCPPDGFSPTGQVWGNPLYKWTYHKKTGYGWWLDRLRQNFKMYDVIRLDHMRGFESFFSIPAHDETAENGHWMRGPRMDFFNTFKKELPGSRFIAEDLGTVTPAVKRLITETGLPGMKVLQFAFDNDPNNLYLPENYEENCVVYTGTHDNDTTAGWYESLSQDEKRGITAYIRSKSGWQGESSLKAPEFGAKTAASALVQIAMNSRAETCIIPVQDYLLLGSEGRINVPGTTEDNWKWRMDKDAITDGVISYIRMLTKEAGR